MSDMTNEKLAADARLAAQCLAETGSFEMGQAILKDCADRIEALQSQLADRDRALAEWADVSQRNYQRAKAAEERLAEARAGLDMLRGVGWQPIDTLPPCFTTVDIWISGGFRVANATHPSQYPTATHWWDFGLGQTSPEPPPDATRAKIGGGE